MRPLLVLGCVGGQRQPPVVELNKSPDPVDQGQVVDVWAEWLETRVPGASKAGGPPQEASISVGYPPLDPRRLALYLVDGTDIG